MLCNALVLESEAAYVSIRKEREKERKRERERERERDLKLLQCIRP